MTLFLFSANAAWAGDGSKIHWVSPTGSATWANCESSSPLSGAAACSIGTAAAGVTAGDLVYLRTGPYRLAQQYGIHINLNQKNGASGNLITFKNYNNENVEFIGTYGVRMWGFVIHNSSYIKLDGIIFSDYSDYLIRASSHHIEITNCTFRNVTSPYRGGTLQMVEDCGGGVDMRCPISHIWLHKNIFYKMSAGGGCSGNTISEGGDPVRIGYMSTTCYQGTNCAQGLNSNITVEDNYMAYGGHVVMESYSIKSIFRNNVAHNEPWYPADNGACSVMHQPVYSNPNYNGFYSHRVWQITDTYSRTYSFNLIEVNRLGYGGVNPNNDGATALTIASPGNIVRHNSAYGSMNNAMKTKYGAGYGWQASGGINNRIYNNTLYKNGYGYPFFQTCTSAQSSTCPKALQGFRWYAQSDNPGNIFMNNIVYGSYGAVEKGLEDVQDNTSGSEIYNNFCTNSDTKCTGVGNPLFINPDLTQTTSLTLPDLHLQSSSPARNGGTFLTQTKGSGTNSLTLAVNDALFFQDGTWGSDLANDQADWIAIGTINNTVQIRSINYTTNVIALVSPKTWTDGANVWLYKNSTGQQMLFGSAPDFGAYEFVESSPTDVFAPSAPGPLSAQTVSASQINLSWTASSDNVGVNNYRVERCSGFNCSSFSLIASPTTNNLNDANLSADTNYSYRVRAADAADNVSGYSAVISLTTPAAPSPVGNLMMAYAFNEGTGAVLTDTSWNNYHGTLTNGPAWTSGKFGNALSFDGVNDYVLTNADPILTNSVTTCAWIYPTAVNNRYSILGNVKYVLSINNGYLSLTSNGFTNEVLSGPSAITANAWSHVCAVRTSTGATTLYVNGTVSGAANQNSPITSGGWNVALGARGSAPAWYFSGKIDEIRIYTRALSPAEIQTDMNAPIAATDAQAPATPTGLKII